MLNKSLISAPLLWDQLFAYLSAVTHHRLTMETTETVSEFPDAESFIDEEVLAALPVENSISEVDVLALALAMVPHMQPYLICDIVCQYVPAGREFPEIAMIRQKERETFVPTGDTLLYLLAGKDLEMRLRLMKYFLEESSLFASDGVSFTEAAYGEPKTAGKLIADEEIVDLATTGAVRKPRMGSNFPASLVTTSLSWEDLVLREKTMDQVMEIGSWLEHNDRLMNDWGLNGKVKPGYRVLFYGAPGTGKTLTATLLGKSTGRDVYRVDLSLVVSKYIGETEKNLAKLFDKAANKEWILFFDEADAIFGKRTSVKDSHDKYANQEVSYLLQRIESHPGLLILASNFRSNLDQAFTRRFQSMIEFEMPSPEERLRLWNETIPKALLLDPEIDLPQIARTYALSGANIVNAVQFCCLKTAKQGSTEISKQDLLAGIRKEYEKEGKMFS